MDFSSKDSTETRRCKEREERVKKNATLKAFGYLQNGVTEQQQPLAIDYKKDSFRDSGKMKKKEREK
jgi:hypothetical protein